MPISHSADLPGILRISDLVALPELRLAVVSGAGHLDRRVEAAHVSELLTPGQWLQGGELLMTIGLLLPMTDRDCAAYVRDVAGAGACALVLGLGRELPHQRAPEPLIRAAGEAGLPLLTVPDEVPFIAVTKAVFAARAAQQRLALEHAFEAQRRLTIAAASGNGVLATLRAWRAATGVDAIVTDPVGRLVADSLAGPPEAPGADGSPDAVALLAAGSDLIRRVAARGLHGSGSSSDAEGVRVEVQPLGARRLRGLLVLAGPVESAARLLVSGLVSLLSLELERRHLADEPVRRRRAALLGRLLAPGTTPEQARDVLAAAGLAAGSVRGVVVGLDGGPGEGADAPGDAAWADAGELAADLALALPGGLVRVAGGAVEAVFGTDLDVYAILGRFAPGRPAGIGPAVEPDAAGSSIRQARGLLAVSRAAGHPVEARHGTASRLLLGLADARTLAGYADAVLGPIDAADPGGELAATLAVWLETGGSWDETSRRLGVHRHTVRNRVDKAMRVAGRRVESGDDRFDLWLAARIRRDSPG
ncbi:PucR family transcriptional regulator [Embleya hyalina]|uniref:PucR family transcriptional regulator n=1 Tax=Embleya hyalina TaxID=516124 RepID=A0A401Z0F8_9ACTN|nr:PucR family transcriptional regulator [Embleya hyalina]GCE00291.1 PucR family transcriptional regulator [Embleya hyalina]